MEILAHSIVSLLPNSNFQSRASLSGTSSVANISNMSFVLKQLQSVKIRSRQQQKHGIVFSSSDPSTPPLDVTKAGGDIWLLEPVGDGDSRHIGFKVKMPSAFEIASNEVIVGRLPDTADMVVPVATVSARHARIRKMGENLVVTDLDSTNGTFIDEKRLTPGVASIVLPGNCVTFGDIHLAIFRVSKLKANGEAPNNLEGSSEPASLID